jgi:hypothetical protein
VEVDLDMLGALVLTRVGGEVDGTNIVIVDECALHQWFVELLKSLPQPACLGYTIGNCPILSLSA